MKEGASIIKKIAAGDSKALARAISLIENEVPGYEQLLQRIPVGDLAGSDTPANKVRSNTQGDTRTHNSRSNAPVIIGITGPPGAGKSTLADGLIGEMVGRQKKVAVLCVDPSSPFKRGAVLGDRIRMSAWYNNPDVFIRSLATRGSLGGLHRKIIEITDLVKAGPFDYIIVETVGVGQSEVEIAGLADTTVVVLMPEAGDEIQAMKAGLMEIADIFVVNKCDRPDADRFVSRLQMQIRESSPQQVIPVIKCIASEKQGVPELFQKITEGRHSPEHAEKKSWLLAEKAWYIIRNRRMQAIDKLALKNDIEQRMKEGHFNFYKYVGEY